jgi:DNA-binding beta-propeller fold protein YncE
MSSIRAALLCLVLAVSVVVPAYPAPSPASPEGSPPAIVKVLNIITGPAPLDSFRRPRGMVADTTRGVVVIADTGNHRLVIFDSHWRSRGTLDYDVGESNGTSAEPASVALDSRGRMFVADQLSDYIEVMTSQGSHITSFRPIFPAKLTTKVHLQDVVVGRSGRIYVLCSGERPGLVVLSPIGEPLVSLGFGPVEKGPFTAPVALAVNADESMMAVVDPLGEKSVLVNSTDGTPLFAFGEHGEGQATFSMAAGATWGPNGNLWVVDTIRHSISVFDRRGGYLGRIGGFGHGPGQFNYPVACAFLGADRLAVLERAGARCQVLQVTVPPATEGHDHLDFSDSGASGIGLATVQGR